MAEIDAAVLADASRALILAGQWERAADLLAAATNGRDGERAALAVAAAEVAVDHDFWRGTRRASSFLIAADAALATTAEPAQLAFALDFLRLRHDYLSALFNADGEFIEPADRDPRVVAEFTERAARLRSVSPDNGYLTFYSGCIAEVLAGDTEAAAALYAEALRLAVAAGDELTESYALRHLGYLASEAGDTQAGLEQSRRSAELRMRAGCVPMALAQQAAVASVLRADGDEPGARAAAAAVLTWSRALRLSWLTAQATALAQPAG